MQNVIAGSYFHTVTVDTMMSETVEVELMLSAIAETFNIKKEELLNIKSRKEPQLFYRQMSWLILKEELGRKITLKRIGELFGGFDHTTITMGIRSLEENMAYNEWLKEKYLEIKSKLKNSYY